MNIKALTLEDCLFIHDYYGLDVVIQDGEVIGIEKYEGIGTSVHYFSFSNRK